MTMTDAKAFMDRFVTFINSGDPQLAEALVAPDAVFHAPGQAEPLRGPGGYLAIIGMMRSGFSDIGWTLEQTVAQGEWIAARFTMRGTHDGNFFGVPASSRKIEVQAMNFYRVVHGKIREEYGQPDFMGLMQQIGAIPG